MKAQTIFNRVLRHLKKQKWERSMMKSTSCAYRSEDGKMCAFGILIKDSEYVKEMEGKNSHALLNEFGLDRLEEHRDLIANLQNLHDSVITFGAKYYNEEIGLIAKVHSLTIPKNVLMPC